MTVASVIKSVYEIKNRPRLASYEESDLSAERDAAKLIAECCGAVKEEMRESYVGKTKATPQEYDSYFAVIQENLLEKAAGKDGDASSYFDLLTSHIPNLTSKVYRGYHRARLEYLGSLVRKRLARAIKREM